MSGLLLWGCELGDNVQGLAEALGNPDPKNVESPGHLVASGHFRGLGFDGNTTDGPYVVAVEHLPGQGEDDTIKTLALLHFPDGEGCNAGPVANFGDSLTQSDAPLDARIPMVTPGTDTEPGTLRFINFKCKADKLTVVGGELPLSDTFAEKTGFLVETADDEILLVDPWRGKRERIASHATSIRQGRRAFFADGPDGAPWMWSIESGELVARDRKLEKTFHAGQDVTSVKHTNNEATGPLLAILDSAKTLFTVEAKDPKSLKELAKDACAVEFNVGAHGAELLYFAPCDDQNLHVAELETGTVYDIRPGISDYKIVGVTETGPVLLYVTAADDKNTTMWARWGQNEPIRLGENGQIGLSRITSEGEARVVVDWDGSGGTLLAGPLGETLKVRARSVAYQTSVSVISDFDGENGTLQRFTETDKLELVAERVSPRGIKNDNQRDRSLFLSNFREEEGNGQLTLIEGDDIRKLSANVHPNSYQFTVQEARVTLLSNFDPTSKTATLKLPSIDFDDEGIINVGVSESLEVDWPSRGLLYSAPAAEEPGIYFAKFY